MINHRAPLKAFTGPLKGRAGPDRWRLASTHNDYGAGDGDGGHGSVGDGVSPVRVVDALVVAVDAPLVRSEHQRQDG